jgi:hypothetical protein
MALVLGIAGIYVVVAYPTDLGDRAEHR